MYMICYYILSKVTKLADISAAWLAGNGKTCDFMIIHVRLSGWQTTVKFVSVTKKALDSPALFF